MKTTRLLLVLLPLILADCREFVDEHPVLEFIEVETAYSMSDSEPNVVVLTGIVTGLKESKITDFGFIIERDSANEVRVEVSEESLFSSPDTFSYHWVADTLVNLYTVQAYVNYQGEEIKGPEQSFSLRFGVYLLNLTGQDCQGVVEGVVLGLNGATVQDYGFVILADDTNDKNSFLSQSERDYQEGTTFSHAIEIEGLDKPLHIRAFAILENENGFYISLEQQVIGPPISADSLNISFDPILCHGESTEIKLDVKGYTPFHTFSWKNENNVEVATVQNPSLGAGTYTVIVTDQNGCEASKIVQLGEPPALIITERDSTIWHCDKASTKVDLFPRATGGTGPYAFQIVPEEGDTSTVFSELGLSEYTIIVTDKNGCTSSKKIVLALPDAPIFIDNEIICEGDNILPLEVEVPAGVDVEWYKQDTGGMPIKTGTSFTPTEAGTYYAEAVGKQSNCPSLERTEVTLTINNKPGPPESTGDQEIDQGEDIPPLTVTEEEGIEVYWYEEPTGGSKLNTAPSNSFTPTTEGTYYAEAVNKQTDCVSSSRTPVKLTINIPPDAPISGDDKSICEGDNIPPLEVEVPAGVDVEWYQQDTGGTPINTGTLFTPTEAGTYYAEAYNSSTELSSSTRTPVTLTINSLPDPPISKRDTLIINQGEAIPPLEVEVPDKIEVYWYKNPAGGPKLDAAPSNSYTPTTAGTYYAEAADKQTGCVSSSRTPVTLTIKD